jgi:Fe-S cluster assembly protein SufD
MDAAKQYIDLYTQQAEVLQRHAPEVMNRRRAEAEEHFRRLGFPSSKDDDYRHTDVSQAFAPNYGLNLSRIPMPVMPHDVFHCDVPNLSTLLYFVVNDSFHEHTAPLPGGGGLLPPGVFAGGMFEFAKRYPDVAARYYGRAARMGADAVTALNTLLAQDGFVLYVPQNLKIERPIQLIHILRSDVDLMANRRILVILEPGAEAKLLVCDHSRSNVRYLATQVVEIFAAEGAFFDYYDLEESSLSTTRFASLYVQQDARSNVLINGITLYNGLTRNNYHVLLHGPDAETTLCGMAIQYREQRVDTHTQMIHSAPRCRSNQLFKNVLNDRAMGAFLGRVRVEPNALKTIAFQTNRNLCTTREAQMYSRPQLEIYADDVKCSHGMSTGQLDEQALFYMRTRGLSSDEARLMLSIAFASDVIAHVRLQGLNERLQRLVEKRFRGQLASCTQCQYFIN